MKVWILKPKNDLDFYDSPWSQWFNKIFTFVIRAEDEKSARELANRYSGKERTCIVKPWLDDKYSECIEVSTEGNSEILHFDMHSL